MRCKQLFVLFTVVTLSACGPRPGVDDDGANNGDANNGDANNGDANNGSANNGGTDDGGTNNGGDDGGNNGATNNEEQADCVPDRESWDVNVQAEVERYCWNCHGETPDFGAPVSLTNYEAIVDGREGERLSDEMLTRLVERSMPPPGSPQPLHNGLDTMVEWASCGQQHPDHSDGLQANRPVFKAPEDPPGGTETFDVTADEFAVGKTVTDLYQCFSIAAPIDEPRLIRRIEPVVDDSRVLHHSLVTIDHTRDDDGTTFDCYGFPPGDEYVYVWGPGQDAIQFEDGGLRIEPGDHFVLQIHYNNGAGAENVMDSSGFRVHHGPVEGKEYGLFEIGPLWFPAIQGGQTSSWTSTCRVDRDVTVRASWPHMHEIGSEFRQIVKREDGSEESIIELTGWSFEAQLIYDTPIELKPGDVLETTCTWDNYRDSTAGFGLGTEDEMCFNFMYATPAVRSFCQ